MSDTAIEDQSMAFVPSFSETSSPIVDPWSRPSLARVISLSDRRKEAVKAELRVGVQFWGVDSPAYDGVLDSYHGESCFSVDRPAQAALSASWDALITGQADLSEPDGHLYGKQQPRVLRELAATHLFRRMHRPLPEIEGVRVSPDQVVVCPYTSTILLEESIAALARPGGVVACPEGFYKSNGIHIEKFGLRIVTFPVSSSVSFKIDVNAMENCLRDLASHNELCGVLLTMPGNPIPVNYERAELEAIATVLCESDVRVVCDAAFDGCVGEYLPIASLRVQTSRGLETLYNRVLTITGNSKSHNAFGPCKFGAACSGDAEWLAATRARLTHAFQRETTHLARAVLEFTTDDYLAGNIAVMRRQQFEARSRVADINHVLGFEAIEVCGTAAEGMFMTVRFDSALLANAGISSSLQLEDLLLAAAGVDSVCLLRMGSPILGVRLNVLAPRKSGVKDPSFINELFDRIHRLLADMTRGLTYRSVLTDLGLGCVQRPSPDRNE